MNLEDTRKIETRKGTGCLIFPLNVMQRKRGIRGLCRSANNLESHHAYTIFKTLHL